MTPLTWVIIVLSLQVALWLICEKENFPWTQKKKD